MKLTINKSLTSDYSDLVNNYVLFHQKYDEKALLELPIWKDDSDEENYQHVDDFFDSLEKVPSPGKTYTLRCPASYLFSSEKTKGGFDRPLYCLEIGDKKCRENLNRGDRGYISSYAGILRVFARKEKDGTHTLVKVWGNHREWMKLLANAGKDVDMLIQLSFHDASVTEHQEMMSLEAQAHSTDAGDRSNQNEDQKFFSSFIAKDPNAVYTFNFLRENQFNYNGVMELNGIPEAKDWIHLNSLQGIKDGAGNGLFKKYGKENVEWAMKTIKAICDITGEKYVNNTPLHCISQMYHFFAELPRYETRSNSETMFTKEELYDFFVTYTEAFSKVSNSMLEENKHKFRLKQLSQSGAIKDFVYLNAKTWWPGIATYWKNVRGYKHSFGVGCYPSLCFIGQANIHLRKEVENILK